ncbi:hypothetical protein [Pseudovibrio sp. Tun.PSC04-5.I4]|uniref:hypothetical protein n=1 Tax=Pseudovibrio sp. Tun.PSC04-5.I4 TaxID=1798213 RepID=UPI00088BBAEF|nr:hypothetical protein [Pseudovibrio sp. Tun.PSC04-5.I4]SDR38164.1 hypothetical protein SAMN04515695_5162 [Pseudovibrio sp. Tun.PSC04-5.I4]
MSKSWFLNATVGISLFLGTSPLLADTLTNQKPLGGSADTSLSKSPTSALKQAPTTTNLADTLIVEGGVPTPIARNAESSIRTLAGSSSASISAETVEAWLGRSINLAWKATKEGTEAAEETFTTFICNAEKLAWKSTTTELGPAKGSANYTVQQVTPTITQISWKDNPQESNLGWVWTLDAATGKAYGVVVNSQPFENLPITGEFTVQITPTAEEKEQFACP